MKAHYNNVFLLFAILLFSVVQSAAQQESVSNNKFAGEYVTGHEFGGGSIRLEIDGTFSVDDGSDDGTKISTSGNYTFSDGVVHFKVIQRTGRRRDDKEYNLLNPDEIREMFGTVVKDEVKKEFKLLPVEWSERIYLIYENDLKDFANAVNFGIEPRASLYSRHYSSPWYGSFYLRSGDERKKVTGKPRLPAEWLSFLLRKPLTATVISIQKVEKKNEFVTIITATVNKGSRHGLKVGMKLLAKDEEPSSWSSPEVISVGRQTAKIEARTKLKVGAALGTRYKPRMFY
jgi:hypothetical protein